MQTQDKKKKKKKIVIAIDGYSSSGKSTMAKALARSLGYRYIDSGAMYRAVTLYAIEHDLVNEAEGTIDVPGLVKSLGDIHISFALNADGSQHTLLNGRDVESDIRNMRVSALVSAVAVIPEVRADLVAKQQAFGAEGGIVMDGRDIGTTVFPRAELKIFVNAPAETRAQRRFAELSAKGSAVSYAEVLANVARRDHIDTTREVSPLRRADDAVDLDNTNMTIAQQDQWLRQQAERAIERAND